MYSGPLRTPFWIFFSKLKIKKSKFQDAIKVVVISIVIFIYRIDFDFLLQVDFWSQHISFILVGTIVFCSTRGLLLTMSKFFIWISSPKSSNFVVLFLSQIMGMYFVSMVLLMRMNMPEEYR